MSATMISLNLQELRVKSFETTPLNGPEGHRNDEFFNAADCANLSGNRVVAASCSLDPFYYTICGSNNSPGSSC